MVVSCSAYNCSERFTQSAKYSFHRFPMNNEQLIRIWCIAMRRKDFIPNKSSRICSKHFTDDSFLPGINFRPLLKSDAVPTIFDFRKKKRNSAKRSYKWSKKRSAPSIVNLHNVEEAEFSAASDDACEVASTQTSLESLENENDALRINIQQLSRKIERFVCITSLLAKKALISEEATMILKSSIEKHNFSNSTS